MPRFSAPTRVRPLTDFWADPLIAVCRAYVEGRPLGHTMHAMAPLDWDATAARAEHERLAPILYVALRDGAAPAPVLPRLRAAWMAAERQHLTAGPQLREIITAFDRASIQAILLKGPLLATDYYSDPALRPFTDLDLLVRRRDRERAIEVLTALGYAHGSPGRSLAHELEHAPAAYFVAQGGCRLPVDLHWECVAHPGGSRATELAAEEIWSRVLPSRSWGAAARTLAPEDLLIYLAAHFAIHHSLAGALWQLDLALVLKRHGATLDWDAVVARSRRWGAAGAVYFALRTVGEALGVTAPTPALNRLRPGELRVALIERLQRGGADRLIRLEYLVGAALLDRPTDIVRMLASGVVPPPRWLRSRYDCRSVARGYLTHYGRMARIVARGLRLQRS
jgi:hypothetical protein